MSSLGRADIVLANAGVVRLGDGGDSAAVWGHIINTNLTGAWTPNTVSVALPTLRAGGRGGSIVIISSTAILRASPDFGVGQAAYAASKTTLVGLMKQSAVTLAPESIRVNSVHPTEVKSVMTMNEAMMSLAMQAAEGSDNSVLAMQNAMSIDILEPEDVFDAVASLVSGQATWITGVALPVDAGFCVR